MKEKKERALELLESVKGRLQFILDEVSYSLDCIEDAETAADLYNALETLGQSMDESQFVADDIQEVFELADGELENMINEEADEAEEEDI